MKHGVRIILSVVAVVLLIMWGVKSGFFYQWFGKINMLTPIYDISDQQVFDRNHEIAEGDGARFEFTDNVQNLHIEAGGCQFQFCISDKDYLYVEGENCGKLQCYVEKDTGYVKVVQKGKNEDAIEKCKVKLWIPGGYHFEDVQIEFGAGALSIEELNAKQAECKVGAGELIAKGVHCEELKVDIGVGNVELTVEEIQKLSAKCAVGNATIHLSGEETDYNYCVEAAAGNISIGEKSFGGVAEKQDINNGSGKNVYLDCALGNIMLQFGGA
ncbi:MAG: DUF4097 domain-containing protein [Acetatifactor sp.]|nr:DUF4097 domain-containing protein [Acetatifactor sp.]